MVSNSSQNWLIHKLSDNRKTSYHRPTINNLKVELTLNIYIKTLRNQQKYTYIQVVIIIQENK